MFLDISSKCCFKLDILTIGIVTIPFKFEGKEKMDIAKEGVVLNISLVLRKDLLVPMVLLVVVFQLRWGQPSQSNTKNRKIIKKNFNETL